MSDTVCYWCETDCGGTCLGLTRSQQMRSDDPAAWMLRDGKTSTPVVNDPDCYICRDPEFAQMGLPLCRPCPACVEAGRGNGHIAADDTVCTVEGCGYEDEPPYGPEDGEPVESPPAPSIVVPPTVTVPLHVALARLADVIDRDQAVLAQLQDPSPDEL